MNCRTKIKISNYKRHNSILLVGKYAHNQQKERKNSSQFPKMMLDFARTEAVQAQMQQYLMLIWLMLAAQVMTLAVVVI